MASSLSLNDLKLHKTKAVRYICIQEQFIPCFDRCQLAMTWMSYFKEICHKRRLHVSVYLLAENGRYIAATTVVFPAYVALLLCGHPGLKEYLQPHVILRSFCFVFKKSCHLNGI